VAVGRELPYRKRFNPSSPDISGISHASEGMQAMDYEVYKSCIARLVAMQNAKEREKAQVRLVEALRTIPRDQRACEAELAIRRLAKQETLEAKHKAPSDDLDKLDINGG
jgi:hypothetical protein